MKRINLYEKNQSIENRNYELIGYSGDLELAELGLIRPKGLIPVEMTLVE